VIKESGSRMSRKLLTGERLRKDGLYEYRYQDRLRKSHSIYGKTLEELREKKEQLEDLRNRGININKSFLTLDDMFDNWQVNKRGLKPNTFRNYVYMYKRYVYGEFGKNKLKDLRRSDFKFFYNYLYDKKHLEVSTIDSIHTVVHQVLELAIGDDYIRYNPSDNAIKELKIEAKEKDKERNKTRNIKSITKQEEERFFYFIKNSLQYCRWYPIFRMLICTGLRAGELAALQRSDLDFDKGIIDINKTIVSYSEEMKNGKCKTVYEIHSPKTDASIRKIPMTDEIRELLHDEFEYQKFAELKCNSCVNGYDDFAFLTIAGTFYKDSTLNKALDRVVKACNEDMMTNQSIKEKVLIPRISCHKFRHTLNTKMQKVGIMVEDRMAILGHSDPGVNVVTYTHVDDDSKKRTMELLSRLEKET